MKKVTFLILLFVLALGSVTSQDNAKVKKLESERKRLFEKIANNTSLLGEMKKTTASLMDRIRMNSEQISLRRKVVVVLNQEINGLIAEQKKIESEIKSLDSELKEKKKMYASAMESMMYRKQNQNKLLFVLSGKSFGESFRRMQYLREYSEWRSQQAEDIKRQQAELVQKNESLEKTKKEKLELLAQRKSEEENLKKEETSLNDDVKEANKKQKDIQTLIEKQQAQAKKLNAQIDQIIAEEIARREREAKRIAEEKARLNKQSGGKQPSGKAPAIEGYAEMEQYSKITSNFAANKGRIPMPVTGRSSIISRFGIQPHPTRPGLKLNNSGIKIRVQSGTDARAVFDGKVLRVLATAGANNNVLVSHGDYMTLYSNLQNIYVRAGQEVKAGESLGRIYTDTDSGSTILEFALRNKTRLLDPELWLKR